MTISHRWVSVDMSSRRHVRSLPLIDQYKLSILGNLLL